MLNRHRRRIGHHKQLQSSVTIGPKVIETIRLAVEEKLSNEQIAARRGRSISTIGNQIKAFYAFARSELPDRALWSQFANETQLREGLPIIWQRIKPVLLARGLVTPAPQIRTVREIRGVQVEFRDAGPGGATAVAETVIRLLAEERVEDLLRFQQQIFLDHDECRMVFRLLSEIADPGQAGRSVSTYLQVLEELRGKMEPQALHARNQTYWQMGHLGLWAPIQELQHAAEHEPHVVPRVAASIALGSIRGVSYVEQAAIDNQAHPLWAAERHAYTLAYTHDELAMAGAYRDHRQTDGLNAFRLLLGEITGDKAFLRPLALQEMAFHLKARPQILVKYPSLSADLHRAIATLDTKGQVEIRLANGILDLVSR